MPYDKGVVAFDTPGLYVISVRGYVNSNASALLQNMSVTNRSTEQSGRFAILSGELHDQAALIGVLNALYERGYVVLSVNRITPA